MRIVLIEPDQDERHAIRSSLEIIALGDGVQLEVSAPGMDDWPTLLRVGECPELVICRPPDGDFVETLRSMVLLAGAAPVLVFCADTNPSLRLEARRLGAEWVTKETDPNYREVWRRIRGSVAYTQSRPEIERRTLAAIVSVLEEVRDTLRNPESRRSNGRRRWDRIWGMIDGRALRLVLWVLGAILAIIGTAIGVDLGIPIVDDQNIGGAQPEATP